MIGRELLGDGGHPKKSVQRQATARFFHVSSSRGAVSASEPSPELPLGGVDLARARRSNSRRMRIQAGRRANASSLVSEAFWLSS